MDCAAIWSSSYSKRYTCEKICISICSLCCSNQDLLYTLVSPSRCLAMRCCKSGCGGWMHCPFLQHMPGGTFFHRVACMPMQANTVHSAYVKIGNKLVLAAMEYSSFVLFYAKHWPALDWTLHIASSAWQRRRWDKVLCITASACLCASSCF